MWLMIYIILFSSMFSGSTWNAWIWPYPDSLSFCHCLCIQGVTFRVESGELVIARILHGGMIDQQGLLHVGDIIKEVNGKEVGNDPKVLQEMLKDASGSVVLKILPSYQEPHTPRQVHTHTFVLCVSRTFRFYCAYVITVHLKFL